MKSLAGEHVLIIVAYLNTGCMRPHIAMAVLTPMGFGSAKSHLIRSWRLQESRHSSTLADQTSNAQLQPTADRGC